MSINLDNEFYCTKCGGRQLFSVPRIGGKERPLGHLKRMYCFSCKEEHNFVETKPYGKYSHNDFLLEYTYGNFTKDGDRIMPYGLFRDKIHKEGVDLHEFE